ncbi:YuzB family protein [Paenibacillus thiaminolyticus]|uniref:YuzB family protein n=1 Tax=Paenibacillus thiaminolyticus TaxID=49283 RepID=UPI00232ADE95|nr:YuzB family protein [Paenibacillus thiaminolyticus]WCF09561.1 YuzB family protein [Paenibacillus thiaminolyticus]
MRPIIELCVNNVHQGTDQLMKRFAALPDADVIEYGCLGNCGECFLFPFAYVNGEIVAAETAEQLYDVIMEKVKEIQAWEQPDAN